MIKLTVAIPTYNRNEVLFRTVRDLLPQLTPECRLVILDNHSTVPVEETLRPLLAEHHHQECTIIRNAVNVGGSANVLRCFEICTTEWIWALGDDDTLAPDAIATLLDTIATHPDLTYANFASEIQPRTRTFMTEGLEQFVRDLDHFGNAMFISSSLYNCPKVQPRLNQAYHYSYTSGPQMVMLMMSLGENGRCLFSSKRIVGWQEKDQEQQSSMVVATIGLPTILELPLSDSVRRSLARAFVHAFFGLRPAARELYYTARITGDFARARLLYDQLTYRLYYFERGPRSWLRIKFYRLALMFPRAFGLVNVWSARLTGRKIRKHSAVRRTE
jgi:glycosyltransferase involved in cell wall biosynthesis